MNDRNLLKICISDRKHSFECVKIGFFKKNQIDLILKMYILLINSFGKMTALNDYSHLFIDEVKNISMINNLRKTRQEFDNNNFNTLFLCLYTLDGKNHVKIGYFKDLALVGKYTICLAKSIFKSLILKKNISEEIMLVLIKIYRKYLNVISQKNIHVYLMSDHHFFSTITAICFSGKSFVLQHGLIMDKRFFFPVFADYFLAWGMRSVNLLKHDKKAIVTGTYKFQIESKSDFSDYDFNTIMFCISSLDNEIVKEKIDCLLELSLENHFQIIVKCHPGSDFDRHYWERIYSSKNITFYQNELLENINFDLAVVENSTIIIDLLSLNKPFILYDSVEGYFSEYADILPQGNTKEEIRQCIKQIYDYDFKAINNILCESELNNQRCDIILFDANS